MFSKVLLLVSLFVAVVVAAPAPPMNDRASPSTIDLKSNVSCTSALSPGGTNPAPSPSVILLNNPSPAQSSSYNPGIGYAAAPQVSGSPSVILLNNPPPTQSSSYNPSVGYGAAPQVSQTGGPSVILLNGPSPTPSSSNNPDVGYGAAPQVPGTNPSVVNLNAPAPSPPVINLNRRQFSSPAPTSTFSFGGIVPSSSISFTPLSSPGTPTTSSSPSFAFGGIITSSPSAPASAVTPSPAVSNGLSTFSSKGTDGVETILLLSTVTVIGDACSSTPAFNPALAFSSSPVIAPSSALPFSLSSSSPSNPTSPALGVNVQASSPTPVSSVSIINLNNPPATTTSAPGFSFSSAPVTSVTPAV
ncbi:hypothetical protein DFH94DRAFT_682079 [Russula ochroleuca]|uniref:Uncharacterized protein n=1 Tax=Russula ochroleuca TaxID=152965 RepID=A0A9P5MWB6_9AGAM|nr:hypothetical protein DFH94DRAFT_682079 [Russula ochroleuca]